METLADYNDTKHVWDEEIRKAVMTLLVRGKPYPNVHVKDAEALIQQMLDKLNEINNFERNKK